MSAAGRRYGATLALTVAALAAAGGVTYAMLRPAPAARESAVAPPLESDASYPVRNVAHIRPDATAWARAALEDRAWRAEVLARTRVLVARGGDVAPWRPSAAQQLDDAVFAATRAGRPAEAALLLEGWLASHPGDVARRREAARLRAAAGQSDAALAHWARAVAQSPDDDALRAEYARALLWNGRHAEAATEWEHLARRSPDAREPRLALAQALAWGGRPADAEPLLAVLAREAPADTATRSLLRATRAAIEPAAVRAAAWTDDDPEWVPYRIALARAHAREGNADAAGAWDRVLADTATVPLLREAAGAAAASGDSLRTATLLAHGVRLAPDDRALRRDWARALAWSGDAAGAIREYGALLADGEDAELRLARGQLLTWMGRTDDGLRDLEIAARLRPTYEAHALIGDIHRWRGRHAAARVHYARALALRPGDVRVVASLAAVRQAERALTGDAPVAEAAGWTLASRYAEDNAGYLFLAAGVARGFAVGGGSVLGVAVDQRRVAQRSARAGTRWVTGYTVTGSATRQVGALGLSASAGVARHAAARDVFVGRLAALLQRPGFALALEAGRAPAYELLWAMRTLADWTDPSWAPRQPMMASTLGARVTVPVGRAQVDLGVERMRLADGNARTSGTVAARLPVGRGVSALYTGGTLGYVRANRAAPYWAPDGYTAHALGAEWGASPVRGVRVAARVLPGVARSDEVAGSPAGVVAPRWVGQLGASADVTLQRGRWSAAVGAGYGRGARGGGGSAGYQSLSGTLTARIDW